MTRVTLLASPIIALALLAGPARSSAAAKTHVLSNGVVKSLTSTALTVSANGKDTTFSVDAKTRIIGKGIGTKADMKGKGGKAAITDLLAVGDRVNVVYQGTGATARATRVELTSKGATK
jgi:hypothetical protein